MLCLQEKDAEIKQIQTDNKKLVTEIQQRHEIEIIEMQDKMRKSQVSLDAVTFLIFTDYCNIRLTN